MSSHLRTQLVTFPAVFIAFLLIISRAGGQVPQMISYQGRVIVGSTNFDGAGAFKFALVNNANGQTLWSNDGSSVNGSEPTNAVSIDVGNGLYSVLLGDSSIANMRAIPNSVFTNSDVRLRVWFNDGTHGSQQLSPDQRIASVGYALMANSVADGAITAPKIANGAIGSSQLSNGAVGANQLAPGAAAANFGTTVANPLNAFVVGSSGIFSDLNQTAWVPTGAKLTIQGTESDKPSFAVVGDHRTGSSGERYATVIYPNGGLVTNAYISVAGVNGHSDPISCFSVQSDVPVAMSLYSAFSAGAGGTLISGWGIPTDGPTYSRVFHVSSQGTLRLVNPYGHGYKTPQLIVRATDVENPDQNDFGIRTYAGQTSLGTWNESQNAFKNSGAWAGLGEIRLTPGKVDIIANVFKTYGGIQVGDNLVDPGANNIAVAGLTADRLVYADSSKKLRSTAYTPADVVRKDQAPKFSVYSAVAQSITANAPTKLTWDTEAFDTNNNFATSRFTPNVAGKYLLTTGVTLTNASQGTEISAFIYKNGVEYARLGWTSTRASGSSPSVNGSVIVDANGTSDYFELYIQHNNGSSLGTLANSSRTYFQGALLP